MTTQLISDAATTSAQQINGNWQLDPVHSSLGFEVTHMRVTRFRGQFNDYDATLTSDDESVELRGSARVESIRTPVEQLHQHLMSPEFFDAERHPELTFFADDVEISDGKVLVRGEITMRGVTRPLELSGTIDGPVDDAYGVPRIGLDVVGELNRFDFGINWNAPLPGGGHAVSETVRLVGTLAFTRKDG